MLFRNDLFKLLKTKRNNARKRTKKSWCISKNTRIMYNCELIPIILDWIFMLYWLLVWIEYFAGVWKKVTRILCLKDFFWPYEAGQKTVSFGTKYDQYVMDGSESVFMSFGVSLLWHETSHKTRESKAAFSLRHSY